MRNLHIKYEHAMWCARLWIFTIASFALALLIPHSSAQSDPALIGLGDWAGALEIRFPEAPVENSPIRIRVPSDGCLQGGPRIDPGLTSIVREGAHVAIDFYAYLMACFSAGDPPTVWSYDQRLGSFAAGDYTISARYHYIESPDASPFATLGASMRVVRGNDQAFALPTISAASALVLGVVIAMIGTTRIRRRRLPT